MKKTLTIAGIIVLALAIALIGVYFFAFSDSVVPASLIVTSGIVQLDSGFGFKSVSGIVELTNDDIILTQDGARAAIVLYESSFTLLEPNTQIEIEDLDKISPTLNQGAGVTFTRFAPLNSMKSLNIKMPSATIIAQGDKSAAYRINMDGVRTANGFVTVKTNNGFENIAETNNAYVLDYSQWNKRQTSTTERAIMRENLVEVTAVIKTIRNNLVFQNKRLLGLAQKQFDVTPVMILEMINQADTGRISASDIAIRVPVKMKVMNRIIALTQIISDETINYYAPANPIN